MTKQQRDINDLAFYIPIGYYQKDGVWYGPCTGVYIWKTKKNEQA